MVFQFSGQIKVKHPSKLLFYAFVRAFGYFSRQRSNRSGLLLLNSRKTLRFPKFIVSDISDFPDFPDFSFSRQIKVGESIFTVALKKGCVTYKVKTKVALLRLRKSPRKMRTRTKRINHCLQFDKFPH